MDELEVFDKIKIGLASDEKIREWSKGENQKKMDYSVREYLDLQKIGNVIVENTKE